ncbi:hypothetical protein AAFF_G00112910 [Aldrovandia affinis]|uniref:DNA polymerase lambda n=1 Tax=Aldrovandia affinis TaxID=143900 RepID=A0AAD7RT13_9TELE|nr:hypothetical protein AAFF_G00112910 [Aldrovandia affinis]
MLLDAPEGVPPPPEMELHGIVKAFPKVKRHGSRVWKEIPPKKSNVDETVTGHLFDGMLVYLLPAGIGNARCDIFKRQITQNGGQVKSALCPGVTHVIVDDSMDSERALRLLKLDSLPQTMQLVRSSWLSQCITGKTLLSIADYSLLPDSHLDAHNKEVEEVAHSADECPAAAKEIPPPLETNQDDASETFPAVKDEHKEEDGVSQNDLDALLNGLQPMAPTSSVAEKTLSGKWVCAQSSQSKIDNHNKHITDKLEVLAKAYTHQGDKWRALSYSKAINALKSYHKPISSYEEACKIQGIGKRMAEKISEIMDSGHLRKIDHMGEAVPVLELFTNIWGAGTKTAQLWYQKGFRTLEDIRTKATLNSQQKIGLKHYDDFLDRMPRDEAAAIEKTVREAAQSLNPGLLAFACGSYRRGKATCGDVDVLITHPDGKSHRGVFSKILSDLRQSGFLTDDLVSQEENGEQKKYLGVCRLPGSGQRHRRLDIIVVPYNEFACSLMYFTGSAHFNRSMRALAKTKKMSLSEHSLNRDVLRQGSQKVSTGVPLPTPTERDVFTHLGIPYRDPHERDW